MRTELAIRCYLMDSAYKSVNGARHRSQETGFFGKIRKLAKILGCVHPDPYQCEANRPSLGKRHASAGITTTSRLKRGRRGGDGGHRTFLGRRTFLGDTVQDARGHTIFLGG